MELLIDRDGREFGMAQVEKEGKRLHVRAKCPFLPDIYRLYLLTGKGDVLPLGVMMPRDGSLALDRTVPCPSGLTPDDLCRAVLCPGDERPEPAAEQPAPRERELPTADPGPFAGIDRWLETARPESLTRDEVLHGTLAGAEGALYRYRSGCVELALPASEHRRLAPALLFARAERIRDRAYYVLRLSPDGLPLPADAPSTY